MTTNVPDADLAGWEIRPNVSQQALYNLLECVMEIAQAIKGLASTWQLNQSQGGMCISGVFKMTERTPRQPIPPSGPVWVATDSAV